MVETVNISLAWNKENGINTKEWRRKTYACTFHVQNRAGQIHILVKPAVAQ